MGVARVLPEQDPIVVPLEPDHLSIDRRARGQESAHTRLHARHAADQKHVGSEHRIRDLEVEIAVVPVHREQPLVRLRIFGQLGVFVFSGVL